MIDVSGGKLLGNAHTVIDELESKHRFIAGPVGILVFTGKKNGKTDSLHNIKLGMNTPFCAQRRAIETTSTT